MVSARAITAREATASEYMNEGMFSESSGDRNDGVVRRTPNDA